jgi:hypothetical protein
MSADKSVSARFAKKPPAGPKHMRATVARPANNVFHIQGRDETWFKSFAIVQAPPGARVVFRCCHHTEKTRANSAGKARSRLVTGGIEGTRRFHAGDVITATLTRKSYVACTLRVRMKVGDFTLSRHC